MLDAQWLPMHNNVCRIRAMEHRDAGAYAEGTEDDSVRAYAHLPEPKYTPESVSELIDGAIRTGLNNGDLAVLAIADPTTDDFCGSVVLFDVDNGGAEVGFWLAPSARGSGLAVASLRLGQHFAQRCGLLSLTARTALENTASQRVLTKAGFIETTRDTGTTPAGIPAALIHYAWTMCK